MSFARFNPDGTQSSPWSTPVDLKGADGRDGKDGIPGPSGPAGSQGNPGKDGADGTRFEYIYRLTNTDEQLDPHILQTKIGMYQKDDLMSHKELMMITNTNGFAKEKKQMELEEHEQLRLYEHILEK